jgi:hypothetical protein
MAMSASDVRTARLSERTGRSSDATVPSRPGRRRAEAPLVLGRYRLHRRLGTGGFGTVWMARDERLDRDVAVKILPRERVVGGRFEREAQAAARLAHPGIVTLYEAAVDDEGAYLVSELVRGATMAQLLAAGRLSDSDVVQTAIALCDALGHAHAHGIVHRDLKPSNVLIPEQPASPAQLAKLTDFGVARVIGGDTLTRTGDVVGTAAYMAPEQAEGREAGAAADLYALALVTYEGLTGVNPVRTGPAAQRARRLGAHLPPLRRQRRDLPRGLGCAIDLALRPRPRERGRIDELRAALAESLPLLGDVPGVVTSAWPALTGGPERAYEADPPPAGDPGAPGARGVSDTDDPDPDAGELPSIRWPARALAAAGAAGTAGWLSAHLLAGAPLAPAAAALAAAIAVAALPRIGWLTVIVALSATTAAQGRAGGAVVLALAGVTPILLNPFRGTDWPLAAGAPWLGLLGLAGAWPALAARAGGPWRRSVLGAAGWIWLVLATPIYGSVLYLQLPPGIPGPAARWAGSLQQTVDLVLRPLLHSGAFAAAPVWAAAAVVLPWIVGARSLAVRFVLVTVWAATVASATVTAVNLIHSPAGPLGISAAATGAVVGALVALTPSAIAAWRIGRARAEVP